ncbi:MAG TPA: 50S ribosomal protein L28 [Candidatus Brachybacterium merdigallinarum]|nr:50S ribosomal protein L28 [Candidatus Brachybacterium merdigallinarum]
MAGEHSQERAGTFEISIHQETTVASSTCDICAKAPVFGKTVSHSHRRHSRRWNPNIQSVRTVVNGTPKRLNVCTSCLKAGKVQKLGA